MPINLPKWLWITLLVLLLVVVPSVLIYLLWRLYKNDKAFSLNLGNYVLGDIQLGGKEAAPTAARAALPVNPGNAQVTAQGKAISAVNSEADEIPYMVQQLPNGLFKMSNGAHLRLRPGRGNSPEDSEYLNQAYIWMDQNEPAKRRIESYKFTETMNRGVFGNPASPAPLEGITVVYQ